MGAMAAVGVGLGEGVSDTDGVFEGDLLGVFERLGVMLGVAEGVRELVGVAVGVRPVDTVLEGVTVGDALGRGVTHEKMRIAPGAPLWKSSALLLPPAPEGCEMGVPNELRKTEGVASAAKLHTQLRLT